MCSKRKEKKKERKKVNQSNKDWRKAKEKIEKKEKEYKKGSWDQIMSEQIWRIIESKKESKSNSNNDLVKTQGMQEVITFLVTNQILFPLLLRGEPKRKKKKEKTEKVKAKTPKSQSSHQNLAF